MIPLAESYYLPDKWVPTVIGNSYGDIYEQAQSSRLNVNEGIPSYFNELMRPILRAKL